MQGAANIKRLQGMSRGRVSVDASSIQVTVSGSGAGEVVAELRRHFAAHARSGRIPEPSIICIKLL